jgi:hypothetical protein
VAGRRRSQLDFDIAILSDPGSLNKDQVMLEWLLWQQKKNQERAGRTE